MRHEKQHWDLISTDLVREERVEGCGGQVALDDGYTQFSNTCCYPHKRGRLSSLIFLVISEHSAGVIKTDHLEMHVEQYLLHRSSFPFFFSSFVPPYLSPLPVFFPSFLLSVLLSSLFLPFLFRTYLNWLISSLKKFGKITTIVTTRECFKLSNKWLWNISLLAAEPGFSCLTFL